MPSQEEVLKAIRDLDGFATLKELKEYFGLTHLKGNSVLPQRLKALERRGLVSRFKCENYKLVIYVSLDLAVDENYTREKLKPLRLWKGRQPNKELEERVFYFVRERTVVSIEEVAEELSIDWETAKRHLENLVDKGLLFKFKRKSWWRYTTNYMLQ